MALAATRPLRPRRRGGNLSAFGVGLVLLLVLQALMMNRSTSLDTFRWLANGAASGPGGTALGAPIPRTVYRSWISRDMAPGMRANFEKWTSMNDDDYDFVFFDDDEQRSWMEANCNKYWPAWRDMELPAARADLFRYCLLHANGGVWTDVDIVPERPLRDFLPSSVRLAVVHDGGMPRGEGEEGFLYNAFLAASPGHPVLERAMDIVMEHYRERLRRGAVFCTGPRVLWRGANDTLEGGARPDDFVGTDEENRVEYLSFDGNYISSAGEGPVLRGKYNGYLKDATMHGGEPHYGREVTWSTKNVEG